MDDGTLAFAAVVACAIFATLLFVAGLSFGVTHGRCAELCRPEKYVQAVDYGRECLCTTKRVKLGGVP